MPSMRFHHGYFYLELSIRIFIRDLEGFYDVS